MINSPVISKVYSLFSRNKIVLLIIFIHLLITVPLAYILNIWYDEACSLFASSGSIAYAVKRSLEYEFQPPFYYILLSIWRTIDNSYFFARLLSIIFSCASILISYKFIKKHLKVPKPEFAAFLIAINPFLIYYALEIRLYTMIIFITGILIFLMYEIYFFDNKSKMYRILYIFLSIIALHSQYYMGFVLVAIGTTVFIYKGWNKFKIYLIDMILPLLSLILVIPFLEVVSVQTQMSDDINKSNLVNIIAIIEFFKVRIVSYVFAIDHTSLIKLSRYELWLFLFLITAVFLFSIRDCIKEFIKIITLKEYNTLPIVIVLLIFFIFIVIKISRGILEIRHTASLFMPLVFTVTSFIYLTSKKKFLIFWFVLFCLLYITTSVNRFIPLAKEGDTIRVSKYLETNEKENEMILVPYKIFSYPLKIHYKGKNTIVNLFDNLSSAEKKEKLLKEIDNKSGFIWWDFPAQYPMWDKLTPSVNASEEFINANFIVLKKKYFEGMELWYLKRKK